MLTIGELIAQLLDLTPGGRRSPTVDTVKAGDPAQLLRGVVTTCLATVAVIQRAIDLDANLIITHEPTYYTHEDETAWLAEDPIYAAKRRMLDEHDLVVWRYHDHIHSLQPDGIVSGLLAQLGWEAYTTPDQPWLCTLPPTRLDKIVAHLAARTGAAHIRTIGERQQRCSRVGLAVGAGGGQRQIGMIRSGALDLLVCGEINEWEVAEYVRDAQLLGHRLALVVLGHLDSEEAGMAWLAGWLSERYPGLAVTHVPAGSPFSR